MNIRIKRPEIPIPDYMKSLEMTDRGYLKPWFVLGDDFRVVDNKKATQAITKKACWICGNSFSSKEYAMVGSPMVTMGRVCMEPPCHVECAEYSVQVCPFILYPNAKRRVAGLPEDRTFDAVNEGKEVKQGEDNPGDYYLVVVNNFAFAPKQKLLVYNEANVIDRQYWIGGEKQAAIPDPIYCLEKLPVILQNHYKKSMTAPPI